MMLTAAILDAMRAELTRTPATTWPTPATIAHTIDPRTINTDALNLIDQALIDLTNTPDGRLIVSMPPQEGKSTRCSRDLPIWALARNRDLRIVTASYAQGLANRNGRAVRNAITAHPELGMTIAHDNGAASEWTLTGHEGGVLSVGRGAGVTGRPADCVRGDMHIDCEYGRLAAADAFSRGITRILAYDHAAGRAVWRTVEAARRIDGRPTLEITTEAGRVLVCTPDHRVYTGRGYVPAWDLRRGDTLVAFMDAGRVPMWGHLSATASGPAKSDHPKAVSLLHAPLHGGDVLDCEPDELLRLRKPHPAKQETHVLQDLRAETESSVTPEGALPRVWDRVSAKVAPDPVLRENVRRSGALASDDWRGQLALQNGHELRQMVPLDATHDLGAGRRGVLGLPAGTDDHLRPQRRDSDTVGTGGSPHQRTAVGQQVGELNHALSLLPHDAPQVAGDTVHMVRESSGKPVAVYDFQVEGTRNFFAEGILVHNCLIIDDPLKDRTEADSLTIRDTCWDWWTDALSARLAPGAPVLLVLTRWHEDDLAGRLTSLDTQAGWRVINIPAQCENPDTDPLGRQAGEYMVSARGRTPSQWEARKATAGARTWAALYQGHPSPAQGDIFHREWWRYWTRMPSLSGRIIQSWDLTFKPGTSSDWVVGQVWMRQGADHYLLDQVRGRWSFTETRDQICNLTAKWPQAVAKYIEDKANGPAIIDELHHQVPGIVPVTPHGSKTERAAAITPLLEAGNVHIPAPNLAPWVDGLVEEAAAFPQGTHDDQVDALTQALSRLSAAPGLRRFHVG